MDPLVLSALISTGGGLLGGGLGSLLGSGGSSGLNRSDMRSIATFQMDQSLRNEEWQKNMAEHGIALRVRDAQAAGLHPLAALGAVPSAGQFGQAISGGPGESREGSRWPEIVNQMGQNVSRAVMAQKTPEEKMLFQQQILNEKAQGDLVKAQTAETLARTAHMAGSPPGLPSPYNLYGGSPTSNVPYWPYVHQAIRGPDGDYNLEYSPEYSQSLMARPMSALGRDILSIMGDAWQGAKSIYQNTIGFRDWSKYQIQPRR